MTDRTGLARPPALEFFSAVCGTDAYSDHRSDGGMSVGEVAICDLLGVSTRRIDRLVHTPSITSLSKNQVSEMATSLDEQVQALRTRPLDAGPCTFVAADAVVWKVRESGRTANVHALLDTGVNADGYWEILGLHVTSAEDGAWSPAFFRGPDSARPHRSEAWSSRHESGCFSRRAAVMLYCEFSLHELSA